MERQPAEGNEPSRDRRSHRIANLGRPVLLYDRVRGAINGKTMDEAFGGLGVIVEHQPELYPGQEADIFHNGMRMTAIVKYVRPAGDNFRIGIAWKSASLSQRARDALRTRKERGLESNDPRYERFIRSIPGSVLSLWSLYESENWVELAGAAERLAKQSRIADMDDLTPYAIRLTRFIDGGEGFETIGEAVHELIETAIANCESLDW